MGQNDGILSHIFNEGVNPIFFIHRGKTKHAILQGKMPIYSRLKISIAYNLLLPFD
jgi:hypothetical protein